MCSIMVLTDKSVKKDDVTQCFDRTTSRGPDDSRIDEIGSGYFCFQRLSIMGLTDEGMQPFHLDKDAVVCNGEIYGFRPMKEELKEKGYTFKSGSDCEILLPLYREYGTRMFKKLGSEFALVIYDGERDEIIAGRDPIGIRPLYYGYLESGAIAFASEPKDLLGLCKKIIIFPPGCYYRKGRFIRYADSAEVTIAAGRRPWKSVKQPIAKRDLDLICAGIRKRLIRSVEERLDTDAPLGFLLSGGLDSSLVCAIAAKLLGKKIRTFAIGMDTDAIDLRYARTAADFIGSDHTEYYMTKDDVISSLPEVIRLLGTWDITTIRASMGMYLCCKAIHENTDVRVLMTGEISDELFGYKYTDFAPNAQAFQTEAEKRVRELHMYDVLRADRCISANSLEARVPFGDREFVRYVMAIDPEVKRNHYQMGKYLLRHAFEKDQILPDEILWRQKAAFSDAVGHSMVDDLKEYAESVYTDAEFEAKRQKYAYRTPFTKESLLYRELFETYYPGQAELIADYWMPNRSWKGCDVNDPSARVLSNYGASGL